MGRFQIRPPKSNFSSAKKALVPKVLIWYNETHVDELDERNAALKEEPRWCESKQAQTNADKS